MSEKQPPIPREGASATSLKLSVVARSDMGVTRTNNEDSYLVYELGARTHHEEAQSKRLSLAPPGVLLAVADGMGGHNAGQVASRLCVEELPEELVGNLTGGDLDPDDALAEAIQATSDHIRQQAARDPDWKGMGTTLTAVYLVENLAWMAQVGDSRAYLLRQGELVQLTQDQTVFNSLSPADRAALVNSPLENVLLQAVGASLELNVVVSEAALLPGDLLLLCSDGLYRVVTPQRIGDVLDRPGSLEEKVETLISETNAGGGPDNVTVILSEVLSG